jgi:hypothetical protein
MEYYLAIKKNEIMLFAGKWMELDIILLKILSEIFIYSGIIMHLIL